jgi:hypothetical protein
MLREMAGALGVNQFDLDKAKIPSGGAARFEVPTLDGTEYVPEITGVIIGQQDVRCFWERGLDESGGGTPPDCTSDDCQVGVGKPGGSCQTCPMAQFGSARKGAGQACQQRRVLFIARPKSTLPLVVSLPPTSLANARKYFLRLVDNELPFWAVVTTLTLEKDRNGAGVDYAKVALKSSATLPEELRARFKTVADDFAPYMKRVAAQAAASAA